MSGTNTAQSAHMLISQRQPPPPTSTTSAVCRVRKCACACIMAVLLAVFLAVMLTVLVQGLDSGSCITPSLCLSSQGLRPQGLHDFHAPQDPSRVDTLEGFQDRGLFIHLPAVDRRR